ncbi:hypothetical protein AB0I35_30715 [Nocardia sp. NPDC050378]|uniref:hypothetical protein n=1 Tax=Nocardia sp. NPDC050378 TaxID=3155400 RepID=UPI0033ED82D0
MTIREENALTGAELEQALARAAQFYPTLEEVDSAPELYAPKPKEAADIDKMIKKSKIDLGITTPIPADEKKNVKPLLSYLQKYEVIMSSRIRNDVLKAVKEKGYAEGRKTFYKSEVWEAAFLQLQYLSYRSNVVYTFRHEGAGVEIPTAMVKALIGATAGNKLVAANEFKNFLTQQQKSLSVDVEAGGDYLGMNILSPCIFMEPIASNMDLLVGQISLFMFDQENTKKLVKANCASAHHVKVEAKATRIDTRFPVSFLDSPNDKKRIDKWMDERLDKIAEAATKFEQFEAKSS